MKVGGRACGVEGSGQIRGVALKFGSGRAGDLVSPSGLRQGPATKQPPLHRGVAEDERLGGVLLIVGPQYAPEKLGHAEEEKVWAGAVVHTLEADQSAAASVGLVEQLAVVGSDHLVVAAVAEDGRDV